MQNKYILSVHPKEYNENHAGSKAVLDVELYTDEMGFEKIDICNKLDNKYIRLKDILMNKFKVKNDNSIILFQYPYFSVKMDYIQNKKSCITVALVHDLECLRFFRNDNNLTKKEINILNRFDYIISHNSKMSKWLKLNGLNSKIVELELFDYKSNLKVKKFNKEKFRTIAFAGNLDKNKSAFIYELDKLEWKNLNINLYGPNYNSQKQHNTNIKYKGKYAPEELHKVFEEGFGLIWDGQDLDTCSGDMGEYTKYNNPHKLSLYISAGLPVIVWKEAAISNFVEKHNIGITIESIYDIKEKLESMEANDYIKMLENIRELQTKVIDGYFIKNAIHKIIEDTKK